VQGAGPYPSRGAIIYEEFVYPPGGTIWVDVGNTGDAPITNARLLFRGSKLYTDGTMWSPTYPERMAVLPSIYQIVVPGVPLVQASPLENLLTINNDADFVFRCGVCDAFTLTSPPPSGSLQFTAGLFQMISSTGQAQGVTNPFDPTQDIAGGVGPTNVFVQLRDENRKAYSNVPIHVNDLFGQGLPTPFGTGSDDDQVLFTPGLITPEIYLPRRHSLYFDVTRNDTSGVPVDLYFRFIGMKVFQR
jgi:hypothetical protein